MQDLSKKFNGEKNTNPILHNASVVIFLFVMVYILIYILPLGMRPLSAPDETRYAEIPREMITTGDWVVPHLIDLRYFEKPVLGYWLNAISMSIFGETNFAVRLSSALSVGLSAFFIWLLMVRNGYSSKSALVSAAIFLTFLEVLIVGTLSILDAPFTLFLTAGMVLFYLASEYNDRLMKQWFYLSASGVLFGLAFLIKGFLAFVLPTIVLVPFILIRKRYNLLWRGAWVVLFALLTILPWAIAIHIREPDFWRYFIFEEHIRRFLAENAQHTEPMTFYLYALPALMFPWFGFLPAAIAGHIKKKRNANFYWFLLLWFCLPFVFFSVSKGKLATYILPCLIPAAILIATGLMNYLQTNKRGWFVVGVIINSAILGFLFIFLFYHDFISASIPFYSSLEFQSQITMLGALLLAAMMMLSSAFMKEKFKRLTFIMFSAGIMLPTVNLYLPDSVNAVKSPVSVAKSVMDTAHADSILVSDANMIRAIAWTFKRTDIYFLFSGELGYGLRYPEHKNKLLEVDGLEILLDKQRVGKIKKDIAVFCEEPCPGSLTSLFDNSAEKFTNNSFSAWLIRGSN